MIRVLFTYLLRWNPCKNRGPFQVGGENQVYRTGSLYWKAPEDVENTLVLGSAPRIGCVTTEVPLPAPTLSSVGPLS